MSATDEILGTVQDVIAGSWREARAEKVAMNTPISYWCYWFPGLKHSPKEFYGSVVQKVRELQIPNLEPDTITLKQGGIFSLSRLYLRLSREKLVFELCAAPFGNGFFVSSRLFDRRRGARWYHVLLAFFVLNIICAVPIALVSRKGFVWGIVIYFGVIALIWSLMRLAQADAIGWLSRKLPEAPLFGRIYESFFNPDTFFRQDTNACYRTAVHDAVMSAIDDMTNQHGIRMLTPEERRPTLGGDQR